MQTCWISEETVSQDLLTSLAPPPELSKLLNALPKLSERPSEQPSEDFLAVLNRALSEKPVERPDEGRTQVRRGRGLLC